MLHFHLWYHLIMLNKASWRSSAVLIEAWNQCKKRSSWKWIKWRLFSVFHVVNETSRVLFLQLHTSHRSHWTVLFWPSLFPHQTSRYPHKHWAPPQASRALETRDAPLLPATVPVDPSMALLLPAAWCHHQVSLAVGWPLPSQPPFHRLVAWALKLREVPPRVDSWDSNLLPTTRAAQGTAPAARGQGPQTLLKGIWQHTREAFSVWSYCTCNVSLPHFLL